MSAVLASYVKLSTMVDGTLRIVLDIEPKHAAEAFALLGSPGTPIAIARITDEAAVAHDARRAEMPEASSHATSAGECHGTGPGEAHNASPVPAERKPLALSSRVALRCQDIEFAHFLEMGRYGDVWRRVECGQSWQAQTVEVVRQLCNVQSRSEIIPGTLAAQAWATVEAEYELWQRRAA